MKLWVVMNDSDYYGPHPWTGHHRSTHDWPCFASERKANEYIENVQLHELQRRDMLAPVEVKFYFDPADAVRRHDAALNRRNDT